MSLPRGLDFEGYYQRRTHWSAIVLFAYVGLNFTLAWTYRDWLLGLPTPAPLAIWLLEWGVIIPACAAAAVIRWKKPGTPLAGRATLLAVIAVALAIVASRWIWTRAGGYFFAILNCYFLIAAMVMSGIKYRTLCFVAVPLLALEIVVSYVLYGWSAAANFEVVSFLTAGFVAVVCGWQVERSMHFAWDEGRYFERLAHVDSLTGLLNRRAFEASARQVLTQAGQLNKSVTVAVLDLDRFKPYNDHYGHPAGDRALSTFARVLARHARNPSELAARIGGEEFVLLWYDLSQEQARQRADAVVRSVRELSTPHDDAETGVLTTSLGAHFADIRAQTPLSRLMREADRNLYAAKRQGGDCFVMTAQLAAR